MSKLIETDHSSYLRDLNSKALLCNDIESLRKHRFEKMKKNNQSSVINNLVNDVEELKNDIQDIKKILLEFMLKEK